MRKAKQVLERFNDDDRVKKLFSQLDDRQDRPNARKNKANGNNGDGSTHSSRRKRGRKSQKEFQKSVESSIEAIASSVKTQGEQFTKATDVLAEQGKSIDKLTTAVGSIQSVLKAKGVDIGSTAAAPMEVQGSALPKKLDFAPGTNPGRLPSVQDPFAGSVNGEKEVEKNEPVLKAPASLSEALSAKRNSERGRGRRIR